jgi:tetratricopeptide (TPR) repeat protein
MSCRSVVQIVMKIILKALTIIALLVGSGCALAAGPTKQDIAKCLGENKEPFLAALKVTCTEVARSKDTPLADRSIIYLHLGDLQTTEDMRLNPSNAKFMSGALNWWREGLKADPANTELHLAEAFGIGENDGEPAKVEYLRPLVERYPQNARYKAKLADALSKDVKGEIVLALCEDAAQLAPDNYQVLMDCAGVAANNQAKEQALEYASQAKAMYVPFQRMVYGMMQPQDPYSFIVYTYKTDGNFQRAFEVLTELKERSGNRLISLNALIRGQMALKIGNLEVAAQDYLDAGMTLPEPNRSQTLARAVFLLNKVGRIAEAKENLEKLIAGNHMKVILVLQVKLRNGQFKNLEITGKYDEATQDAIRACLSSKECSDDFMAVKI